MCFFRGPQAENFTQLEPRLDKSEDNNHAAPLCDTQASTHEHILLLPGRSR